MKKEIKKLKIKIEEIMKNKKSIKKEKRKVLKNF